MLVGLSATFITGPDSDDENIGGAMTAIFGFFFLHKFYCMHCETVGVDYR